MEKLIKELERICLPQSKIPIFIKNRLLDKNYRGLHFSQHNRWNLNMIIRILTELNNFTSSEDFMEILVGDDTGSYECSIDKYRKFVQNIKDTLNSGTLNTIKKNIFPDLARMGLIERFNKNFILINEQQKKQSVKFVRISKLGKKLLEKNADERLIIFSICIKRLMNGYFTKIFDILCESLEKVKAKFSPETWMLFLTGIDQIFSEKKYTLDNIKNYLIEYQKLNKFKKCAFITAIKNYCKECHANRKKYNLSKDLDRDWHNWKNEAQQIINILALTAHFEKDNNYNLFIRIGKGGVVDSEKNLGRSLIEKKKYMQMHEIEKKPGFNLHHIVPLEQADTAEQWKLIDCWENMIYIDAYSHSKIHHYKDKLFLN